jgi:nucleoside-diphosphate-sugar epimerase
MPIPTPEDTLLALPGLDQPRTSYMLSKIYGEAMVRHSGVPFTILRPHNIYGPRMGSSHVIPELLQKRTTRSKAAASRSSPSIIAARSASSTTVWR